MDAAGQAVVTIEGLQLLLDGLRRHGYRIVGPTGRDQTIIYDDIASLNDLPRGWTDEQDGGHYRLLRRDDDALFGYAVGPHSWKKFLHPPTLRLWRSERDAQGVRVVAEQHPRERLAFVGARACELRAIAIQDEVFLGGAYVDAHYQALRADAFVIAVNCGQAGGTCFCASMNAAETIGCFSERSDVFVGARRLLRDATGLGKGVGHDVANADVDLAKRCFRGRGLEAGLRALLYVMGGGGADERQFNALEVIRNNAPENERVSLSKLKSILRQQAALLRADAPRAMAAIPAMLPDDPGRCKKVIDTITEVDSEAARRLDEVRNLFGAINTRAWELPRPVLVKSK